MRGVAPPGGRWLRFYAVEIARGPDGAWRVLGDRAEAPFGLGYALENRLIMARAVPRFSNARSPLSRSSAPTTSALL